MASLSFRWDPGSWARGVRGRSLCGLAYVAMFLSLGMVLRTSFGFPLDDSWIHEVIARNLAETGVLGFIPGQLSSGSTSLLWTMILAVRTEVLPGVSPVTYCFALSCVLLGGLGVAMKALTERDGMPPAMGWCLALGPAASGNFLWFGLIGMEHLLFLLLAVCVLLAWFQQAKPSRAGALGTGLLCLLLVLTRPEGVFVVGLLLLLRPASGRTTAEWFEAAAGAGLGALLTVAASWRTSGRVTPLTLEGRGGMRFTQDSLLVRVHFLEHTVSHLLSVWSARVGTTILSGRGLVAGVPVVMALAVLVGFAVLELWRSGAMRYLALCGWAAMVEVLYFVLLPATGHGGRYIAMSIMLFVPLVLFGLSEGAKRLGAGQRTAWALVLVAGAATSAMSMETWRGVARAGIVQINTEHGAMGAWIRNGVSREAIAEGQVAAYDVGRIGYDLHGNLVDLGGLVDQRFHAYAVNGRTGSYLASRGVRFVVLPTNTADEGSGYGEELSLNPQHGVWLTPVNSVCADAELASRAFTMTGAASRCQRLYRIAYEDPGKSKTCCGDEVALVGQEVRRQDRTIEER